MCLSHKFLTVLMLLVAVLISDQSADAIRPLPPNPAMIKAAPEDCAFYFHSFGFTRPDPHSSNKTEQLLADPDIQEFFAECKNFCDLIIKKAMQEAPTDKERAEIEFAFSTMKKLVWRPMTAYGGKLDISEEEPTFQLGLMIDLGEYETDAKDAARRLEEAAGEAANSTTVSGVPCVEVRQEGEPPVTWAVHQGLFLLTVGDDSFRDLIEQMESDMPSWMNPVVQRLPVEQRGMFGYFNFNQFDKIIAQSDEPELQTFWKEFGLEGVNHGSFVVGLEGDGLIVRKLLSCDKMDGIFKLADNEGLSADDIARIPAGAASATAMRVDPADVFDTVVDIARRLDPKAEAQIAESRRQLAAMLGGLDLRDDLLASLGDKWVVYQSGGFATMMVPDMVAAVNLRDPEKASRSLDAIVQLASQALQSQADQARGGFVSIKPKKFGDAQGYSVRGLPVALSFSVHDNELIVGLSAAAIKNHLKYQPDVANSIAVNPRLKTLLDKYENPLVVSYSDVAKSVETMYPSLQMMLNMASGPLAQQGLEFDPSAIPPVASITQYLEPSVFAVSRVPDGIEVEVREVMPRISGSAVGAPLAVALLLPAVNAARAAARRSAAINNGRQLGLAILNYESANGHLPSADANGLSWRVRVLPYLDEQALYDKFHLDEPWDSEHNKALIKEMPGLYMSPAGKVSVGKTHYLTVRGKDPAIISGERGIKIGKIRDGMSKTVLIVEVDDDHVVPWSKPDDFEWTEDDPSEGLGGLHPGDVFVAVFVDGSVHVIPKTVDKHVLSALFTKSGGEVVDLDALTP